MAKRIALLGWGSLLWDKREEFDATHGEWQYEGPVLKLEFCRVSTSRHGALSLVIDTEHGSATTVAYCLSRRADLAEAIEDLQLREGTAARHIGNLDNTGKGRCRDQASKEGILAWAVAGNMDAVVWTDLPGNFAGVIGKPFTVTAAVEHLQTLEGDARSGALEYIRRAPEFVQTPVRDAVAKRFKT